MFAFKKKQKRAQALEDQVTVFTKYLVFAAALIILFEFFLLFLVAPVWVR